MGVLLARDRGGCPLRNGPIPCYPADDHPGPRERELEEAFEGYLEVLHDAHITLDTSHLPEVAIDPRLANAIFGVEARREFTHIASEEFSLGRVSVLSYSDTEASAKIRWNYRRFTQDFETGERDYGPTEDGTGGMLGLSL